MSKVRALAALALVLVLWLGVVYAVAVGYRTMPGANYGCTPEPLPVLSGIFGEQLESYCGS